mgnify:CR=1 FL=1
MRYLIQAKIQSYRLMKDKVNKEEAIDEIVKIIKDFQYNEELSETYEREILDQDKIYDWPIELYYKSKYYKSCLLIKVQILLNTA